MKTTVKGIMMALIIFFCSASVVSAYNVNWPTLGGQGATHFGQIYPDFITTGQHLVLDIDRDTGDLYLYCIFADGSPGTVQFVDGSLWPAFLYGLFLDRDPVTQIAIFDFFISGTGIPGTFAFWATFSLYGL
ncbi:MAG: hypothetical protein IMF11_07520 [Proteobacteria bacterium]|nr:hypothetical protein [Pseudomonadota bacterium]